MTINELRSKKIDRMRSVPNLIKLAKEAMKIEYTPGDETNHKVHFILSDICRQINCLGGTCPEEITKAERDTWEEYRKVKEAHAIETSKKIWAEAEPELKKKGLITGYTYDMKVTAKIPGKRKRVYGYLNFSIDGHKPYIAEIGCTQNTNSVHYLAYYGIPYESDWHREGLYAKSFIEIIKQYNIKAA